MPDPGSSPWQALILHPERIEFTGFPANAGSPKYSDRPQFIPDPDPGRNDVFDKFSTFYE